RHFAPLGIAVQRRGSIGWYDCVVDGPPAQDAWVGQRFGQIAYALGAKRLRAPVVERVRAEIQGRVAIPSGYARYELTEKIELAPDERWRSCSHQQAEVGIQCGTGGKPPRIRRYAAGGENDDARQSRPHDGTWYAHVALPKDAACERSAGG